ADGGASDPQAHLRPFRRGFVRSLGGEPVLPVLLRRGVFPTRVGVRPFVVDALAPADGRGEASGLRHELERGAIEALDNVAVGDVRSQAVHVRQPCPLMPSRMALTDYTTPM